jgi:DMSO/TMAO reductase YedYZ molybdopterin-dependent catalytic subunit
MRKAFYYGLISAAAAESISAILRFTLGVATLPEVLADAIVRRIPLNLFSWAVNSAGSRAKIFLVLALFLVLIAAGGLAATLFDRISNHLKNTKGVNIWWSGIVLGLVCWLLSMIVILPASGIGFFGTGLPSFPIVMISSWFFGFLIYALALAVLVSRPESRLIYPLAYGTSRRSFLKTLSYVGLGLLAAGAAGSLVWKFLLSASANAFEVGQMPKIVTSNEQFYSVSKDFTDPVVNEHTWKLEIGGLVGRSLSIDYETLKSLPAVNFYLTLECIGNEIGGDLIGNAQWTGVRLRDLLSRASIQDGATRAVFYGSDSYSDSISLDRAMGEAFLVYQMNGQPLPPKHGFPVRLLVADIYGMKNVKWLIKIELVDHDYLGFWEGAGWSNQAVIQTMSKIDVPAGVSHVKLGDPILLGGVAFAGDRTISKVEVSIDGGLTWNEAAVSDPLSQFSWVLWMYNWMASGLGDHIIQVRATDGLGKVQSPDRTDPLPDGATGIDSELVIVNPDA